MDLIRSLCVFRLLRKDMFLAVYRETLLSSMIVVVMKLTFFPRTDCSGRVRSTNIGYIPSRVFMVIVVLSVMGWVISMSVVMVVRAGKILKWVMKIGLISSLLTIYV